MPEMFSLPALPLVLVLTAAHPVTATTTARASSLARCEPSLTSTIGWTTLGALFGGLVGYTALSREHQNRPQVYVGAGLLIGGGLGFAASQGDREACPGNKAPQ